MKARIAIAAIAAAASAGAAAIADKLTGRDPARGAQTIAEPDRLADKLTEQHRRGQRP